MRRHVGILGAALVTLVCACSGAPSQPQTPASPQPEATQASDPVKEGEEALKAGDFQKARSVFESVVAKQPQHAKANHYLGVVYEKLGDKEQAEKHYRVALSAAPELTEAAINLSALLIDAQRYADAVTLLRPVTASHPKDALLQTNLGYALSGAKDVDGAIGAFQAALGIADNPETRLALAELLVGAKRGEEAVPELRKLASTADAKVELLATVAELFGKAKDYPDCISTFDKAIAQKDAAELHQGRGICRRASKDHAGAKADYQKAIELDPNAAQAYYLLGQHLLNIEHKKAEAIKAFETCAKLAPQSHCKQAAEDARKGKK